MRNISLSASSYLALWDCQDLTRCFPVRDDCGRYSRGKRFSGDFRLSTRIPRGASALRAVSNDENVAVEADEQTEFAQQEQGSMQFVSP